MPTIAETWKEEGRLEGRQEGRLEGRLEGRTEEARTLLEYLLQERFGALPENLAAQVQQADYASLKAWLRRALVAPSLEDVFRSL